MTPRLAAAVPDHLVPATPLAFYGRAPFGAEASTALSWRRGCAARPYPRDCAAVDFDGRVDASIQGLSSEIRHPEQRRLRRLVRVIPVANGFVHGPLEQVVSPAERPRAVVGRFGKGVTRRVDLADAEPRLGAALPLARNVPGARSSPRTCVGCPAESLRLDPLAGRCPLPVPVFPLRLRATAELPRGSPAGSSPLPASAPGCREVFHQPLVRPVASCDSRSASLADAPSWAGGGACAACAGCSSTSSVPVSYDESSSSSIASSSASGQGSRRPRLRVRRQQPRSPSGRSSSFSRPHACCVPSCCPPLSLLLWCRRHSALHLLLHLSVLGLELQELNLQRHLGHLLLEPRRSPPGFFMWAFHFSRATAGTARGRRSTKTSPGILSSGSCITCPTRFVAVVCPRTDRPRSGSPVPRLPRP